MDKTMKAVIVRSYGGPEVLSYEDVSIPVPGSGEVLVRVRAAGVGPWDALIRTGHSGIPQALPLIPGSDIAGTIESLGGDDESLHPGDEVYGVTNASFTGGYAQFAVASAGMIAAKPRSLDFIQAASAPVVSVTAWQMLFDYAHVSAGQSVLVLGAAGNVGTYARQLARNAGVSVVETSDSTVDAAIDLVGGEPQNAALRCVKPGGVLVSAVSKPSQELAAARGVRAEFILVNVTSADLTRIAGLFDSGKLTSNVGTVLPLSRAREAHEMLAGTLPHPRGKIVLAS
jgi:NADPH:quinone reductase-like Zn-dependent oxidoreductase